MELVGRLAGGVAHDFNNVLTAIIGLAQMTVETMSADDPRRTDIDDILKFSERAAAITSQLLAFSRKQFSQPRPLDLAAHIKNAEKMLRRATGEAVEILVTDTVLKGRNGPELADRLMELEPGIKVLFISGQTADPAVQDRILTRHRPFLAKPFTPEALLSKVRQVLDSTSA